MVKNPDEACRFFRPRPVSFDLTGLRTQINGLYFDNNCCLPQLADDSADLFTLSEAEAFVSRVFKGAYKDGSYDKERVNTYARAFSKAVIKGYAAGKDGQISFDFDSPDTKMLDALKNNVFHFSAAKNRTEIKALSAALVDGNGKLRNFKDFSIEARKITDEFQGRYMKVEYDLAVNASTMAARWTEYESDDILVFHTAGDNRVRPEHALLNGIAKPKSDKFWDTYFPPLSWNCRCTTVVTHSGKVTPEKDIPAGIIDSVPPMFRGNFAKEGFVFPPDHPYFKNEK